jgi:NADH-quinone oxidoreductase subunit F
VYEGHGMLSDVDLIGELSKNMLGRTFCPLGDAAAMPTIAFVEKFRDEFLAYIKSKPMAAQPDPLLQLTAV